MCAIQTLTLNNPGRLRTYSPLWKKWDANLAQGRLAGSARRQEGVYRVTWRLRAAPCAVCTVAWALHCVRQRDALGQWLTVQVVVIKQFDEGNKEHGFPYVIAAGIERYPLKVNKRMGAKKLARRSKIKPFVKVINYNHLFPTRYALELEGLKGVATNDTFKEVSQREAAKKEIKKLFEERYQSGKNRWFFTPLRVRNERKCVLLTLQF